MADITIPLGSAVLKFATQSPGNDPQPLSWNSDTPNKVSVTPTPDSFGCFIVGLALTTGDVSVTVTVVNSSPPITKSHTVAVVPPVSSVDF